MVQALDRDGRGHGQDETAAVKHLDWRKRMSDHVAFALLVYTGLQIFMTATALKGQPGSILPYFALVFLVAAIIPACRLAEKRWDKLSDAEASDPSLYPSFRRDAIFLWACAIGTPVLLTVLFKSASALI